MTSGHQEGIPSSRARKNKETPETRGYSIKAFSYFMNQGTQLPKESH